MGSCRPLWRLPLARRLRRAGSRCSRRRAGCVRGSSSRLLRGSGWFEEAGHRDQAFLLVVLSVADAFAERCSVAAEHLPARHTPVVMRVELLGYEMAAGDLLVKADHVSQ